MNKALWLAPLIAAFAIQADASNIVLDPSFEGPIPNSVWTAPDSLDGDGWFVTAGSAATDDVTDGIGVPHSGLQFLSLDLNTVLNTVSQPLATTVGQSYEVSFWVADRLADIFIADFGSQVLFNGTAPTNGTSSASDYVNQTYIVTAVSSTTMLSFSGQQNLGGGTLLDDVSVTAVSATPEPATFGCAALGCLALFALRRRSV
jgi:hypothetical protein